MIGLYAIGFCFYFFHIPEKWFPGRFDYWCHSHQIWHLCVVFAILVWFITSIETSSLLINKGCIAFIHQDLLTRQGGESSHSFITSEEQEELNQLGSNSSILEEMLSVGNSNNFVSDVNIHLHEAFDSMIQPNSLRGSK